MNCLRKQEVATDPLGTLVASESNLKGSSTSRLLPTKQLISELKGLVLPNASTTSKGKGNP